MMKSDSKKFLIVMEDQSYLSQSIEAAFEKREYSPISVNIAGASQMISDETVKGYLFFTGPELLKKSVGVKVIVDHAIKESIPVFVAGNIYELDTLWETLPKQLVMDVFLRPVNVQEMADSINGQMHAFYNAKKHTILAVDDSGVVLRKIKMLLEDTYDIVLANSGTMAIKYLTMKQPELILLDYEMPIVNGGQVMQMIREDKEFADIPIIFLTAKNDVDTVKNVMSLKPDGYLLKNSEPHMLHKAIDDFFDGGNHQGVL